MPIRRNPPPPSTVLDIEIKRENHSYVGKYERVVLNWFMTVMPLWVSPDMLTTVGFLGSVITAVGYATGHMHLASLGLVVHWFGDSLDGFCARYRHHSRPRYGLFLDSMVDALSICCMICGMGLSPYADIQLAMVTTLLAMFVFHMVIFSMLMEGVYRIDVDGLGGTEGRIGVILLNVGLNAANPAWRTFLCTNVLRGGCVVLVISILQRFLVVAGTLRDADDKRLEDREAKEEARGQGAKEEGGGGAIKLE